MWARLRSSTSCSVGLRGSINFFTILSSCRLNSFSDLFAVNLTLHHILFFALFVFLIFIFLLYSFFNRAYGFPHVSYAGVSTCRPKPWSLTKSALMT